MAKNKCECKKGAPMWMSTFSDMSTLLMTFFILLLSMSSMDKKKIKEALGSLKGALGVLNSGSKTEMDPDDILSRVSFIKNVRTVSQKTTSGVKNYIDSTDLSKVISVKESKSGVRIRILDSVLFREGSAELLPQARPVLEKLGSIIDASPYNILVEGHTDDIPYNNSLYPSNWELSTARALVVLRFFEGLKIKPQRMAAAGFGEYHPILPNITPENRAQNRRVEINLINPEYAEAHKSVFEKDSNGGF